MISDAGSREARVRKIGAITPHVPDLGQAQQFHADAFGLDAQALSSDTAMLLRFEGVFVFLTQSPTVSMTWTRD